MLLSPITSAAYHSDSTTMFVAKVSQVYIYGRLGSHAGHRKALATGWHSARQAATPVTASGYPDTNINFPSQGY